MGRKRKLGRGKRRIYGAVTSPSDIRRYNRIIRSQIRKARSRARLTELVKRSQYFVTLSGGWDHSTPSPSWRELIEKYPNIGRVAYEEYVKTTRVANQVAREHGWTADYGSD